MNHTTPTPLALYAAARQWLAAGRPAVDVSVRSHRGSVPREAGTHMLVAADAVLGTVGGGHLELQAVEAARRHLAAARADASTWAALAARPQVWPVALGPSLGQCCGGHVTLQLRPLDAAALAGWALPPPRFHLQLHGAGHVGRAIARLLAGIDCRVQWVDERESEFPPACADDPPHIERVIADPPEADVASAPPGAAYLVLTHSHALDLAITTAILKRGDVGFCGLIGSATKRARFLHRLAERGVPAAAIERLTCPIGVPGIAGKEPEVLAIGVVAQLLQLPPLDAPGGAAALAVEPAATTASARST